MCNNDKVHNPKKRSTYRAIFVWLQTGIFFISALAAPRIALLAQADTEFWFVAPEVAGINGEDPLVLMIGSVGMPAEVSIDLPADPGFVPLSHSLAALEVRIVDLSPWRDRLENGPANTVLNKGLRITATTPINSYYSIASDNNADIFALKGRQALGRAFFIPAQTDFINVGGRSGFDVVATQDGTQVEITPAADIVGHLAGIPFLIQLNRGQSFSCRELGTGPGNHLAGSQVVADRPIAVSISDESIVTSGANGGRDLLGDQLIPVRLLGKEYILMRGEADIERVYVAATVDQTQVQMDGQAAVLQQGETCIRPRGRGRIPPQHTARVRAALIGLWPGTGLRAHSHPYLHGHAPRQIHPSCQRKFFCLSPHPHRQ